MTNRRGVSFLWFSPILLAFFAMGEREPVRAMPLGGITSAVFGTQMVSRTKAEFLRLSSLRRSDSNAVTMDAVGAASLIVDFGAFYGVWILNGGVGWTQLHQVSPEEVIAGDLDGNGVDDIIVDFGSLYGVWIRMNNIDWFQLDPWSPTHMVVGDLDNSGRDDIVANYEGSGVWRWMNNSTWQQLHTADSTVFVTGNFDNTAGDDVALTFPGYGVWRWRNNATWEQVHALDADLMAVGDLDFNLSTIDGADDLALSIPGVGVVVSNNLGAPWPLFLQPALRMVAGDLSGQGRDRLFVDLGTGSGIWMVFVDFFVPEGERIASASSRHMVTADLDGNGRDELIVDFGEPYGIWSWNGARTPQPNFPPLWTQVHPLTSEGLASGNLD